MDSKKIGQLGEFRIIREIARGGMGIIYEAEQIQLKRRVALKVLPVGIAPDPRAVKLFRREAFAAGKLSHPNIVPIHSVGQEGNIHYFVMDYISGITLTQLINEAKLKDKSTVVETDTVVDHNAVTKPISFSVMDKVKSEGEDSLDNYPTNGLRKEYFDTIARYIIQVAEALDYAHRHKIIHRDIKPSNLMLTDDGRIMVMDFGLAKEEDATKMPRTDHTLGTMWYMSPEQIDPNLSPVDKRTDIYSLGVTLYQLLTLRLPFPHNERQRLFNEIMFNDPPRPCDLVHQLPRDLETITLKAMEKDANQRYQSAQEMADDLQRYLDSEPIWAKPPTLLDRICKVTKRHKITVGVAAVSLFALVLVISISGYLLYRSEKERTAALVRGMIASARGLIRVKSYEDAYGCLRTALRYVPNNREIEQLMNSITGSVSFTTIPRDASVYLSYINTVTTEIAKERLLLGVTPCKNEHLLIGEYKADIEKDGYGRLEFLINVKPHQKTEIKKTLIGLKDLPDGLTVKGKKIICEKDGAEMVFIPAGKFSMGTDSYTDGPLHSVYLDSYYIDKYEVTNAQYKRFLDWIKATGDHSRCHLEERLLVTLLCVMGVRDAFNGKDHAPRFWNDDDPTNPRQPVVGVDWYDAYSYAAWAGKALPSEAEWEKAAKGETNSIFPWGNSEANSLRAVYGSQSLCEVGTCPAGISPYGCYDMSGNAIEWCYDWYSEGYYKISPRKNPTGPPVGICRVYRGGAWGYVPFLIRCSFRSGWRPVVRDNYTGFRCVKR